MSPVWNQPPSNALVVPSSLRKYPFSTCSPRMTISPTTPGGHSFMCVVDHLHVGQAHRRAARREQVLLAVDGPHVSRLREGQHVAAELGHAEARSTRSGRTARSRRAAPRPASPPRRSRCRAGVARLYSLTFGCIRIKFNMVGAIAVPVIRCLSTSCIHSSGSNIGVQHDTAATHVGQRHRVPRHVAQRERHEVALVGLRLVLDHRLDARPR